MNTKAFLAMIRDKKIPPEPPDLLQAQFENIAQNFQMRANCIELGMYAIVAKSWVKNLADWINKRTVLEIMSGSGWLAKALTEENTFVIATDNYSWKHCQNSVFSIRKLDAVKAVKTIQADILLVSWPPYTDNTLIKVCELWNKPIIYIGENSGGCNAPDEFFENFIPSENQPQIDFPSWPYIHDEIIIGEYKSAR